MEMPTDTTRTRDPVKRFVHLPEEKSAELTEWLFDLEAERRREVLRALIRMEPEDVEQFCELEDEERQELADDVLAELSGMQTAEESRDIYRVVEKLRTLRDTVQDDRKTA